MKKSLLLLCGILVLSQAIHAESLITKIDARIANINSNSNIFDYSTPVSKKATSLGSEKQLTENVDFFDRVRVTSGTYAFYEYFFNLGFGHLYSQGTVDLTIRLDNTGMITLFINQLKKLEFPQNTTTTTKYIFTKTFGDKTARLIIYLSPNGDKYTLNILYGIKEMGHFDERAVGAVDSGTW